MTEKEIQLLGFEMQTDEGEEGCAPWHYYTYTIAQGFEFITNASDETVDGDWWVEFFDTTPAIRFTDFAKMQALLNLLEKHRV